MTHYYRAHVPGATCFFSVHLARRDTTLLTDRIHDLSGAVRYVPARHPFVSLNEIVRACIGAGPIRASRNRELTLNVPPVRSR